MDNSSLVHKITDKNTHILIRLKDNSTGIFSYKSGNIGIIESLSKSSIITKGDTIRTYGTEIYPPNIPFAKVKSINNNPNRNTLEVKVELLVNMKDLQNVFVIHPSSY